MKVNMDKLDLKKCKTDKEEYDKAIRSLDYKIVETSVEMYNSKNHNAQFSIQDDENSRTSQLNFKIQQYEEEKANLTKEFWKKLVAIKSELNKIINDKIKNFPEQKDDFLLTSFLVNKITDVYFEPDELITLSYLLEEAETIETAETNITQEVDKKDDVPIEKVVETDEKTDVESKVEQKKEIEPEVGQEEKHESVLIPVKEEKEINIPFKPVTEIKENFKPVQPVPQFNIEEQRIVDFENLLNHINKISKDYRTDIERALSRFIINYKIVKNTQYLKNDFDNITNNYLDIFKSIILKFKKDESLDALQERIQNQENETKNIEKKLLTNNIEIKEILRQMQELSKVYFVGGYVRKLLNQVAKIQGEQDENDTNKGETEKNIFVPAKDSAENNTNDVFQKIKKLAYDKRMSHIIEVSKWTKNVEERLTIFHLEESDFQFVIYLIRQTENVCNSNFEQVANIIISLCEANQQLEVVEKTENRKNKELQEEINTTEILKDGIENIKKKYTKIPFIGRKVSSILSAKMLNE